MKKLKLNKETISLLDSISKMGLVGGVSTASGCLNWTSVMLTQCNCGSQKTFKFAGDERCFDDGCPPLPPK